MSAAVMSISSRTWRTLVKQRRKKATFRIYLIVRGRRIVKEYKDENEFRKWKAAYEQNKKYPESGIESMHVEVVYQ